MNGQQRPANPHRFAIWRSKPFPDGTPPKAEFSINCFLPLDVLRQLYDAIASGVIVPEQDRNGVPGITLWGSGYRGTGAPTANGGTSPVMSGNFQLPKALWQAQQAAQQQQVAPAYADAFPPQQPAQQAPQAVSPLPMQQAAPAPAPTPAPAPGGGWAVAPQPTGGNQWASQVPDF